MAPKGMGNIVKQVMVPTDKSLEGRALAVWYSRRSFQLCVVSIYCPVGDRDRANSNRTEKLWQWAALIREKMPARVTMLVGTDANGHVGSIRTRTTENPYRDLMGVQDDQDYIHIGAFGSEQENQSGTYLKEFLEKSEMAAVNTRDWRSAGKTWFGGNGRSSRVDYILVDVSKIQPGDRCIRSPEMHRRLRTLVDREVNDHVPLCWQFQYFQGTWKRRDPPV